jgi:uncharacterized protein YdeI (YjbR/CyaY-like superfamily)
MGSRSAAIDAYIAKSRDFAKPILTHLREVVHEACPDAVETTKWGAPHFEYHGLLCGMAAFKEHCSFGFWKGSLVVGTDAGDAMSAGQFGRITKVADLPPKTELKRYVKKAMQLNDEGVKSPPRRKAVKKPDIPVPAYFHAALRKNTKARATFEAFSPSHRREYLEWITEAKTEATRDRRVETAIGWLSEGKSRNWKYQ